jgi:hypothetical protein
VIGASGCGKSSLVRAGLLPALREGHLGDRSVPWLCVTSRPGAAPYRELAADMLSTAGSTLPLETLEQTLRRGPNGLRDAVRDLLPSPSHKMLVLIDQFEELFRFGNLESVTGEERWSSDSARQGFNDAYAFIDMLVTAANSRDADFYVAITMRSDYVGECDTFRDLPEWVTRCQFLPPRLTLDEMRDAIERPPQYRVKEGEQWIPVFNGSVDSAVTSTLIAAMSEYQEPLPLAQHALLRMWNDAAAESTGPVRISRRHAERCLGRDADSSAFFRGDWIAGALAQHADELYDSLGDHHPDLAAQRKRIARRMFCALCEEGGAGRRVRRLTSISEVAAIAEADPAEPLLRQ